MTNYPFTLIHVVLLLVINRITKKKYLIYVGGDWCSILTLDLVWIVYWRSVNVSSSFPNGFSLVMPTDYHSLMSHISTWLVWVDKVIKENIKPWKKSSRVWPFFLCMLKIPLINFFIILISTRRSVLLKFLYASSMAFLVLVSVTKMF